MENINSKDEEIADDHGIRRIRKVFANFLSLSEYN
jgi:hypothetical protein